VRLLQVLQGAALYMLHTPPFHACNLAGALASSD
jgi:hypothetical protein